MSRFDDLERTNPLRITGTVGVEPLPNAAAWLHDQSLPAAVNEANAVSATMAYYVEDGTYGKRWYFGNVTHWNPYRGLGSMSKSFMYDVDDALKERGHTYMHDWWDNSTDPDECGPVLRAGDEVTFIPKRKEQLMLNDQGEILVETKSNSLYTHSVLPPANFEGMAFRVALDMRNTEYATRSRVPKL